MLMIWSSCLALPMLLCLLIKLFWYHRYCKFLFKGWNLLFYIATRSTAVHKHHFNRVADYWQNLRQLFTFRNEISEIVSLHFDFLMVYSSMFAISKLILFTVNTVWFGWQCTITTFRVFDDKHHVISCCVSHFINT